MKRRVLYGRSDEQAEIERLLSGEGAGTGGALVVRGGVGIGKTALLDHAADHAANIAGDARVLRVAGVESEAGLPFAALQLLLGPHLGLLDALPGAQAEALRGALRLARGEDPDRSLVGLAVLGLLGELAPVVCLVDDAHWLDRPSAEALLFAARRPGPERIVIMFAGPAEGWPWAAGLGLPELRPAPLDARTAGRLLAESAPELPAGLDERLVEQAEGNPLALLELPAVLVPDEWAGFSIGTVPATGPVHEAFRARIRALPVPTQRLLALVAADQGEQAGDLGVLVEAAAELGVPFGALDPAERAGLVQCARSSVTFRHPLTRAAAYQGARLADRLAVHRALAEVFGRTGDLVGRARHLAASALGNDEPIAAELERTALHVRERDYAAAAVTYERAARLTPEPRTRARRLLAAAEAAVATGRLQWAADLVGQTDQADDHGLRTRLARIRASIQFEQGSPRTAARILLEAVADSDGLATSVHLLGEAGFHAWCGGDRATFAEATARLSGLEIPEGHPLRSYAPVLGVLSALFDGDQETAQHLLRGLIRERDNRVPVRLQLFAADAALLAGDDETAADRAGALVASYRRRGQVVLLPHGLQALAQAQLFLGEHSEARATVVEALDIAKETGQRHRASTLNGVLARLAAIAGEEDEAHALAAKALTGDMPARAWSGCSLGLLDLGQGRPREAYERLHEVLQGPTGHTLMAGFALSDQVEAAVRAGVPELGREPAARFADFAEHSGRPWARAVALRCRALLATGGEAESLYREAARLHQQGGRPFERARTELLFGEWLRRALRRNDARRHLRTALGIFERLGARPWAERARAELRAAGDSDALPPAGLELLARLSPQEMQVVRLAATGASNREIGAQLFLSHRTVGYHLYKAFPKLGIAARAELAKLDLADQVA